ncbi:hypothetical protein J4731_02000 [Providencia rettgeri]|nr:hypothetical protein [Providencia rettgeri]
MGNNHFDLTYVGNGSQHAVGDFQRNTPNGAIYNITNQQPQALKQTLNQLFSELNLDCEIRSAYPLLYVIASLLEAIGYLTGKEPLLTRYSLGAAYFTMTLDNQKHSKNWVTILYIVCNKVFI